MMDLKAVQQNIEEARQARMAAESVGLDLEYLIEQMRAGRTLQDIDCDERADS
jgi:hypothetical protein